MDFTNLVRRRTVGIEGVWDCSRRRKHLIETTEDCGVTSKNPGCSQLACSLCRIIPVLEAVRVYANINGPALLSCILRSLLSSTPSQTSYYFTFTKSNGYSSNIYNTRTNTPYTAIGEPCFHVFHMAG